MTSTSTSEMQQPGTYYCHERKVILDLVPSEAYRVLDIGCGVGALGKAIKLRQNAEVHGIEIVPEVAVKASENLDHVWACPVEEVLNELADGYYDCIVMADVLEHLLDPWGTLATLRTKLAVGGKLVASIPNVMNWAVLEDLIEGRFEYQAEGILDRTHLRFFTRKSVEELIWSAGYRINHISTNQRGPTPSKKFLKAIRKEGLSGRFLEQDGGVFQFIVEAEAPLPMATPKVAIVILNWNGKNDTLECLESVLSIDYENFEVIVVDNGSTDGSQAAIKDKFKNIKLIETGVNLGYAGGNNVGIRLALQHEFDYILILNNDTIVSKFLLHKLVSTAKATPKESVIGNQIYYNHDKDLIWYAGAKWDKKILGFRHVSQGHHRGGCKSTIVTECDYITGCVLFAHADMFRKVGLFDESYFLTYEETDWCYRAKEIGARCLVVGPGEVWHKVSASFGGSSSPIVRYFLTRNRLIWARRHANYSIRLQLHINGIIFLLKIISPILNIEVASMLNPKMFYWQIVSQLRQVKINLANPANRAAMSGLMDYYLGRFGDCPEKIRSL